MKNRALYFIFTSFSFFLFSIGYSQQVEGSQQESTISQGTTVIEQVYSPGLEGNLLGDPSTQSVKVYLPPGYHDYPDNKYPVVYLLHGHTQNYNSYYSSYGLLKRLNDMILDKSIAPMIVVTPNGNNKYTGSMYTNSHVSGNWEDFIVRDVVQLIESKYQTLNSPHSRGLGGFSSGGYGTIKLGMKHPSVFKSICTIGISITSFKERFLEGTGNESITAAAKVDEWSMGLPWKVRNRWSNAVAFAPDSTALPVLGRFPFTTEGELIDSTWQKWLKHDPFSMLTTHIDSMLQLDAIQMYVGNQDFVLDQNNIFHQALIDSGIEHGFQSYSGDHDPIPVLNKLLVFFSKNLKGVVPNITLNNESLLTVGETLLVETDMAGSVYIVPDSISAALDSIENHTVMWVETVADSLYEIELSGIPFGHYKAYGVSKEGGVSIYPGEFTYLPDTTLPILSLDSSVDIIIFPNPSDGTITIKTSGQPPYGIEIFTLNGHLLYKADRKENSFQIDLSHFQKGVYFITIRSTDFISTRKIIKL